MKTIFGMMGMLVFLMLFSVPGSAAWEEPATGWTGEWEASSGKTLADHSLNIPWTNRGYQIGTDMTIRESGGVKFMHLDHRANKYANLIMTSQNARNLRSVKKDSKLMFQFGVRATSADKDCSSMLFSYGWERDAGKMLYFLMFLEPTGVRVMGNSANYTGDVKSAFHDVRVTIDNATATYALFLDGSTLPALSGPLAPSDSSGKGAGYVEVYGFGGSYTVGGEAEMTYFRWSNGSAPQPEAKPLYISDLSKCLPASALSGREEKGKWRLVDYEAEKCSGKIISAASYIAAPDVNVPLNVPGWHSIYVGYWLPYYTWEGPTTVKAKLSDDKAFLRIKQNEEMLNGNAEYIREVFLKDADLTGKSLVLSKVNGALAQQCHIAYVKLVPLSPEQVTEIKADRERRDTKNLVATIDGMSFFWSCEYRSKDQLRELVERYRDSDVGKVLLAVNSGDMTWYPGSKVARQYSGDDDRTTLVDTAKAMPGSYVWSEKVMHDSIKELAAKGISVENTLAEHAHSMGLKLDIMFRLGMGGHLPPYRSDKTYVQLHPEFRQVTRDGTPVEKASYAFPEVRKFMLSLIREGAERFDIDGINLCFTRGPHFLLYEKPVLDAFKAKYNEDARQVDPSDPRLSEVKAAFMSDFVKQARNVLDEVGKKKGKRLDMSVWVWPSTRSVWLGKTPIEEGLDVKGWIKDDLLDSVICQEGFDEDYMKLGKDHHCQFIYFSGWTGDRAMSPANAAAGYKAGVDGFAYWDIDSVQDTPSTWQWLRRIGHRDEMENWKDPGRTLMQFKTIGGFDVLQNVEQDVYSGG